MPPRNPENWDYLQSLCHPSVRSYDQYKEAVANGRQEARIYLQEEGTLLPSRGFLQKLHYMVFREVYPAAGSFRTEPIRFGSNHSGAFPSQIPIQLDTLRQELFGLFSLAETDAHAAQAICYYHAVFELIHPFQDGNGRLGRLIADVQAEALLPSPNLTTPHPDAYLQSMEETRSGQTLSALATTLLGFQLPAELSSSPFPVSLDPFVYRHRLPSGRVMETVCENSQEAEAVKLRLESPEIIKELEGLHPDAEYPLDILQVSRRPKEASSEPNRSQELEPEIEI